MSRIGLLTNHAARAKPAPFRLCPVQVALVRRPLVESCGHRQEELVGNGVFKFLPEWPVPLFPHDAAITKLVPSLCHIGKDGLSHAQVVRSEEHTSELQSPCNLVCRLLLEKKKNTQIIMLTTKKQKKKNNKR